MRRRHSGTRIHARKTERLRIFSTTQAVKRTGSADGNGPLDSQTQPKMLRMLGLGKKRSSRGPIGEAPAQDKGAQIESRLAQELYARGGVIELCYPGTARPHFLLDLQNQQLRHVIISNLVSDTFAIDEQETNDNQVAFHGRMKSGSNSWNLCIQRWPHGARNAETELSANVSMAGVEWKHRTIHHVHSL